MSTQISIEYIKLKKDGIEADVHVYEECMEDRTQVYIESSQDGEEPYCESIVVRRDVWDALVKALQVRTTS